MNSGNGYRVVPRAELETMAGKARDGQYIAKGYRPAETVEFARLRKLEEWLEHERTRSAEGRYEMALDEDFFDGLQWDPEDAAVLIDRGQAPVVYNKVQTSVKWVTGTEKRTRIDYRVYPRSKDDRDGAQNKTKLMKYLGDVNKAAFARSRAFDDAVKVGIGWLECGIRQDPTQELLFTRYESWRNMHYDSHSTERDLRDARYVIRQRSTDVDIGCAMFPKKAAQIRAAGTTSEMAEIEDNEEFYIGGLLTAMGHQSHNGVTTTSRTFVGGSTLTSNTRERVRFYEMWYRFPHTIQTFVGGGLHGVAFDPEDDIHNWMVQRDEAISVVERVQLAMRAAVFIKGTLCDDVLSPYRFNDFPFTPIWGNRRGRDGQPYGLIRNMRDPQESFNKRMSKALFVMSSRRIVMEKGAVEDLDELRDEAARPDSIIQHKRGAEFEMTTDTAIAEEHLKYAQLDSMMIEQVGGVTDENLGRRTNATSGKAIEARQDQGSVVTTDFFDSLRFSTQTHGQKELSLIEQNYTFEKTVRILGERTGYDFVTLNHPGQNKETGEEEIQDDITKSQADFIVSTQDFRESMRQGAFEQLMEMTMNVAKTGPEGMGIALKMLDDVLEFADIPGVEMLIKTIREITGKRAADDPLTPEEQAAVDQAKAAEQQKQQMAEEIAMKGAMAEVEEKMAKIEKLRAEAAKINAEMGQGDNGEADARLAQIKEDTTKLVEGLRDKVRDMQLQTAIAKLGGESKETIARLQAATSIETATIAAKAKLGTVDMQTTHQAEMAGEDFARQQFAQRTDQKFQSSEADAARQHAEQLAESDRQHAAGQAERDREHQESQAESTREFEASQAQAGRGHETREAREGRNHEAKQQVRQFGVQEKTAKLAADTKLKGAANPAAKKPAAKKR